MKQRTPDENSFKWWYKSVDVVKKRWYRHHHHNDYTINDSDKTEKHLPSLKDQRNVSFEQDLPVIHHNQHPDVFLPSLRQRDTLEPSKSQLYKIQGPQPTRLSSSQVMREVMMSGSVGGWWNKVKKRELIKQKHELVKQILMQQELSKVSLRTKR